MRPANLDDKTLAKIQALIEANFSGRDELYAAGKSVDDKARELICRRLAAYLAANAIELQQIVAASGVDPAGPLDTEALARKLLDLAKSNRGESAVLRAAAEGEHSLKEEYDEAIEVIPDREAEAILRRHRDEVEFGEQVLRSIDNPSAEGEKGQR